MPVNRTDSVRIFLEHCANPHLAALYHAGMEVQVNVRAAGEYTEGVTENGRRWHGWRTRDGYVIKHFRIPWKANATPEYVDSPLRWPIERHAQAIGLTGWSFNPPESVFFVYDFDSLVGHSEGLTDQELAEVRTRLCDLPWVTVRRSKSGNGLHCYVHLKEPIPTKNHTEHAAVARSILIKMGQQSLFDFNSSVDVCGGNAWIWHRDAADNGFELIREAEEQIYAPLDWRDHLNLLSRTRRRPKPTGADDDFYKLAGSQPLIQVDEEHQRLITYLEQIGAFYYWQPENNCLVTHTYSLGQAHDELGLKGAFSTVATGKDYQQDKNCFAFPLPHGVWAIRRFSKGVRESPTWTIDSSGWTMCYYNREPRVKELVDSTLEKDFDKANVYFATYGEVVELNKKMGGDCLNLPEEFQGREFQVKTSPTGIEFRVNKLEGEKSYNAPDGWLSAHGCFKHQVTEYDDQEHLMIDAVGGMDDLIRMVLPPNANTDSTAKYYARNTDGSWNRIDMHQATSLLRARFGGNVDLRKEALREHPWKRVFLPFRQEYPGHRTWNMDAVTYAVEPKEGEFPTWVKLYEHWGENLNLDLANDLWAQEHGVLTGRQYLELWVACVLQEPQFKLPYLFFYGDQNGGKSFFHETLHYLIANQGVIDASNALRDRHNAELAKAVVCVADDVDFRKEKSIVYEKIKRYVTGLRMNVDQKYLSIFEVDNFTHWIQCNNRVDCCPIFPGDTRITVIRVDPVASSERLPKENLEILLRSEAPCFLNYLLTLPIPPCNDRLRIPCISTGAKEEAMANNENIVNLFLEEHTIPSPGSVIIVDSILERMKTAHGVDMDARVFNRQLAARFMRGRMVDTSTACVANIRWSTDPPPDDVRPFQSRGRYLVRTK